MISEGLVYISQVLRYLINLELGSESSTNSSALMLTASCGTKIQTQVDLISVLAFPVYHFPIPIAFSFYNPLQIGKAEE